MQHHVNVKLSLACLQRLLVCSKLLLKLCSVLSWTPRFQGNKGSLCMT